MNDSELFVVCKNCSAEVSPYVTECPYCGERVRKRAPKLDRGEPRRGSRRRRVSLPPLRRDEIPGIAPDTRPVATIALIAVSLLATIVLTSGAVTGRGLGAIVAPLGGDWWRVVTAPFLHWSDARGWDAGYQFVALIAVAIFGTHLERRFGPVAVVAGFVLCGGAGVAAGALVAAHSSFGSFPVVGANGAALGLLCAWFVDDRRAAAGGAYRQTDLIGVYVLAAVLLLLSAAERDASASAAVAGGACGAAIGLVLPALVRR